MTNDGATALAVALKITFDKVYIINLPERDERRREITNQFRKIGVSIDSGFVSFFPAIRPADQAEFPSIGARGCFLSHLEVISYALRDGNSSILILEDDADWTSAALNSRHDFPRVLSETPWTFLHGGLGKSASSNVSGVELHPLRPDQPMSLTHFIGLRGSAIKSAKEFLTEMLKRPAGSEQGGPMHVDGAYSWLREAHPEITGYICEPSLAKQRPSESDITPASGIRALPIIRHFLTIVRRVRKIM